jgi:hypothetical protein
MRFAVLPVLALALLFPAACGGGDDDGGGGGTIDSGSDPADAGDSIDASGGDIAIGDTCDTEVEDSCGADLGCISLNGGTNPWCTVPCTMAGLEDPVCNAAYDGPGLVGCFFSITPEGGGEAINVCGVVCDAPDEQCPPATCSGECPATLVCTPNEATPGVSFCQ